METSDAVHRSDGDRGAFVIERDRKRLASMTYFVEDEVMYIEHTEVDPSLRGEGAGARMVEAAVAWARERNLRIMPICAFARSLLARNPEYRDVFGG
jgi:uncharacterized protein